MNASFGPFESSEARSGNVTKGASDTLAKARIALCYVWKQHRLPDLSAAPRFTEMVQRRKLYDRDPMQPVLMDKLAVKRIVANVLGPEWVVPLAWEGLELPTFRPFACPAILKARHGCNQNRVLRSAPSPAEWVALRRLSRGWTARRYGTWLDEWAYRDTPRGLIAEPLLEQDGALPVDYKIYVFAGRATHVQVHLDRAGRHRWVLHDRDWRMLAPGPDAPPPPRSLVAMLEAAEALAAQTSRVGREFLRVDFYQIEGKPLFGEFCLYPGSGLDPFAADWIDVELGALWHEATARRTAPTGML